MVFSNKVYNILKWVVTIVLPATSALYFGLAQIWNWPNAEQVVGSIAVVTTFLGALLGISSSSYNRSGARYDGDLEIGEDEDGTTTFFLNYNDDVAAIPGKDEVTFKVKK